jgi:HSP20 family protein
MDPFKRDKNNRRKNPFDIFGIDDDYIRDLFQDDRVMDDIRRMTEEMMKMFSNAEPGKPFVHGFKIDFDSNGRPKIEDFGNRPVQSPEGQPKISEEREPLTDIIEGDEDVAVTMELPGVEKHDIDLNVLKDILEINVNTPQRKYHKVIDLPCGVKPKTTKATYKNGILDIVIKRQEKKKDGEGYRVNID